MATGKKKATDEEIDSELELDGLDEELDDGGVELEEGEEELEEGLEEGEEESTEEESDDSEEGSDEESAEETEEETEEGSDEESAEEGEEGATEGTEDEEEDIVLDEPEEEAPAPAKKGVKKAATAPAVQSGKASAAKTTKTKTVKTPVKKGYDDLFTEVVDKVNTYQSVMEDREANGSTVIPPSVIISRDLLLALLAAKATEENEGYIKDMCVKMMAKMQYDKEEASAELAKYNFTKTDMESILSFVTDVLYDVLSAGSGFAMFKNDDVNFSMRGVWVPEQISENKYLNTKKASKIDSYLAIKTKSPAPSNKKTLGKIVNGKFIAEKAVTPAAPAAPAKKAAPAPTAPAKKVTAPAAPAKKVVAPAAPAKKVAPAPTKKK